MLTAIELAVRLGVAKDRTEFIRMTMSEKLERLGIFKRLLEKHG